MSLLRSITLRVPLFLLIVCEYVTPDRVASNIISPGVNTAEKNVFARWTILLDSSSLIFMENPSLLLEHTIEIVSAWADIVDKKNI